MGEEEGAAHRGWSLGGNGVVAVDSLRGWVGKGEGGCGCGCGFDFVRGGCGIVQFMMHLNDIYNISSRLGFKFVYFIPHIFINICMYDYILYVYRVSHTVCICQPYVYFCRSIYVLVR